MLIIIRIILVVGVGIWIAEVRERVIETMMDIITSKSNDSSWDGRGRNDIKVRFKIKVGVSVRRVATSI